MTCGDAEAGFISATGLFRAPSTTVQRAVEITAERTLADGTLAQALAQLTVQAMPLPTGERRLPAAMGGAVVSADGRSRLPVPPDAVAADAVAFARPVRVEFLLDRRATPGELLPRFVEQVGAAGASWVAADLAAVVLADGFTAAAELPHFSRWSALRPRPLLPVAPVASMEPASLREWELRPLLLRGSDFNNVTRAEIFDGSPLALAPTTLMEVRHFAYEPATPREVCVLLKSLPNPRLAGLTNLTYRLRLTVRPGGDSRGAHNGNWARRICPRTRPVTHDPGESAGEPGHFLPDRGRGRCAPREPGPCAGVAGDRFSGTSRHGHRRRTRVTGRTGPATRRHAGARPFAHRGRGRSPAGIRLVSLDGPKGIEINFDHVRLDAVAVPELANVGGAIGASAARPAAANRQA